MKSRAALFAFLGVATIVALWALVGLIQVFPRHPVAVSVTVFATWIAFCLLAVFDFLRFDRSEARAHRALARNLGNES